MGLGIKKRASWDERPPLKKMPKAHNQKGQYLGKGFKPKKGSNSYGKGA